MADSSSELCMTTHHYDSNYVSGFHNRKSKADLEPVAIEISCDDLSVIKAAGDLSSSGPGTQLS